MYNNKGIFWLCNHLHEVTTTFCQSQGLSQLAGSTVLSSKKLEIFGPRKGLVSKCLITLKPKKFLQQNMPEKLKL